MIHRLDLARGKLGTDGDAYRQIIWTTLAVALAVAVLFVLRDHRLLRRYTYVTMAVGFVLLLLPLVPGIGRTINGSQIWISVGPLNFQPGEFAKIALAIFFAGYLVQTRDVLSLAGKKVLGFTFPRGRDLGPILVAWVLALLDPRLPEGPRLGPALLRSLRRDALRRHRARVVDRHRPAALRAPPSPSPCRRSRTSRSASTCGSTPSRRTTSSAPTSWPTACGAWRRAVSPAPGSARAGPT